jgi:RNA polymerase sigma factor (sigma-70 family)
MNTKALSIPSLRPKSPATAEAWDKKGHRYRPLTGSANTTRNLQSGSCHELSRINKQKEPWQLQTTKLTTLEELADLAGAGCVRRLGKPLLTRTRGRSPEQKVGRTIEPTSNMKNNINPKDYLNLARKLAWPFYNKAMSVSAASNTGNAYLPDLSSFVARANEGLWKAAEKYDPGRGAKFSTFAYGVITRYLQRAFRDFLRLVNRYKQAAALDARAKDDDSNACERYEVMDVEAAAHPDAQTLPRRSRPDEELVRKEARRAVWEAVDRLPRLQRKVIKYHFGLNGTKELCQQKIAARFGVSIRQIKRLEHAAKAALDNELGVGLLDDLRPSGRRPGVPKGKHISSDS